jgi:GT2 family glycosyltransferase
LEALRRQSVDALEIIVVDDHSTDETAQLLQGLSDSRIIWVRNERHEGLSRSRNRGLSLASGSIVFFTDDDCTPIRTWVEEGLQCFITPDVVGVEGRTLPAGSILSLAHRSVINDSGGQWQTCNIAYRAELLRRLGGFDERYVIAYEDRDLALRAQRHGRLVFCPDMLVFHDIIRWTWRDILSNAARGRDRVRLIVDHGDRAARWGPVVEPSSLMVLLCPVLLLLVYPLRSSADLIGIPMLWGRSLILRIVIWRSAWGAGRFLI